MSFSKFIEISTLLVPVLLLAGIITGCYYYKYLKKEFRFLLLYLIICFIIDVTSRIAGEFYNNNLIFIILFSLCEVLFFTIFYQVCFFKRKMWPYIIAGTASVIYIIWEIYTMWETPPSEFQTYSRALSSFIIIIMAIHFLFEKIEHEQKNNNAIKLNSVFIIFFSLHLIFFLPINFLINVPSSVKYYFWCANLLLTMFFYIFLSREIWRNGSTQKLLQSGL